MARGKGLEGIEVMGKKKKTKVSVCSNINQKLGLTQFLYEYYNIAKHISVHIVLST